MTENYFFIAVLKATPANSVVEIAGHVDCKSATKFGLVASERLVPKNVGLTFKQILIRM